MKKTISMLLISILTISLVLSGCGKKNPKKYKVALLTCNLAMQDLSNQLIWGSIERFSAETGVESKTVIATNTEEGEAAIDQLVSEGFNIIINNNPVLNTAVVNKTAAHAKVTFACTEGKIPGQIPANLISATIRTEESGFLAGVIAARKAQNGRVALIGGAEDVTSSGFEDGYRAGVSYVSSAMAMEIGYGGSGLAYSEAKNYAARFYSRGADMIFVSSPGDVGKGAIESAKEQNKPIITVSDMSEVSPGNIIASVMKASDLLGYDLVKGIYDDTIKGGTVVSYGIADGKAGLIKTPNTATLLGDSLLAEVDQISEMIKNGTIKIQTR